MNLQSLFLMKLFRNASKLEVNFFLSFENIKNPSNNFYSAYIAELIQNTSDLEKYLNNEEFVETKKLYERKKKELKEMQDFYQAQVTLFSKFSR